jgi:hypothetical protein
MNRMRILLATIVILGTSAGISIFADTDPTIPAASPISISFVQGTAATISLAGTSNDGGSIIFATTTSPSHGTLSMIAGTDVIYTPDAGYAGTDSFSFVAIEGATTSPAALVSIEVRAPTPTGTVHVTVRDGTTIATSSSLTIPLTGTTSVSAGGAHDVGADSALAALVALDASSTEFSITDLSYSAGFASFLVNCISVPAASSSSDCYDWHYVVNGAAPAVGMDHYALKDGDTMYVYFGSPHTLALATTTVAVGSPLQVTAQTYDPVAGAYVPGTGLVVGAVTFNPDFSANEFATTTIGADGSGNLTLTATGTYEVGIRDDFYYPSQTITVTEAGSAPGTVGGFSGGSDPYAQTTFNIPSALTYLTSQQKPDGSFANDYITDWAAFAFAKYPGTARDKLVAYLKTHTPAFSNITDYERHAMALEALGISPFDGSPANAIQPILAAFDGTQIGDASLDTDDIFALFALMHAGYTVQTPFMKKIGTQVLSKQQPDGSWDGIPDTTAAAMLALGDFFEPGGLSPVLLGASFGRGQGYLVSQQQADGGWRNADSTSWVQTMINGVNLDDPAHAQSWATPSGKTPLNYLASQQQTDGGVRSLSEQSDTRAWSTAYAIVAASGQSWHSLMGYFTPPSASTGFSGGTNPYATTAAATSATSTATSTSVAASTTPSTASTTPTIATSTVSSIAVVAPSPASTPDQTITTNKPLKKMPAVSKKSQVTQAAASVLSQTQVATATEAQPSLFGRIVGWFRHLLGW